MAMGVFWCPGGVGVPLAIQWLFTGYSLAIPLLLVHQLLSGTGATLLPQSTPMVGMESYVALGPAGNDSPDCHTSTSIEGQTHNMITSDRFQARNFDIKSY